MKSHLLFIASILSSTAALAQEEEIIVSGFRQTLLESIHAKQASWEHADIPILEEEVIERCGTDVQDTPIFYEAASLSFNQELLTGMMLYAINHPDECEEYAKEWYCSEYDFSNTRAFVAIDKNGDEMSEGFVCKLYSDTPDQRFYESDTLETHGCTEVEIDRDDGDPFVIYPHDF